MASDSRSLQGQLLLGAVGAFDWSGGALLYDTHSRRGHFLNQTVVDAKAGKHGYLGEGAAQPGVLRLHLSCIRFPVGNSPDRSHAPTDGPWLGTPILKIRASWEGTGPPPYLIVGWPWVVASGRRGLTINDSGG